MPAHSEEGGGTADWVLSFYRFYALADPCALRDAVAAACVERSLLGTVVLAKEGVNAALCGSRQNLESLLAALFSDMLGVRTNWAVVGQERPAFRRLKVRAKDEIVGFGRTLAADVPVGEHVDAAAWDRLIDDPEVRLVDTRNAYESHLGTFRGSTPAATRTFREFVDFAKRELDAARDKRVALFCTGGIRCEKASAYLLEQGFEQVYQLKGGILGYLGAGDRAALAGGRRFEGECFVFDERVSVAGDLGTGSYRLCPQCGWPLPLEPQAGCPACCR